MDRGWVKRAGEKGLSQRLVRSPGLWWLSVELGIFADERTGAVMLGDPIAAEFADRVVIGPAGARRRTTGRPWALGYTNDSKPFVQDQNARACRQQYRNHD